MAEARNDAYSTAFIRKRFVKGEIYRGKHLSKCDFNKAAHFEMDFLL